MLLAWFISGNPLTGLKIGLAEVVTKMVLYYLHERIWFKMRSGLVKGRSEKRHFGKTITWRIGLISGDPMVGLQVGAAEVVTKMVLYYLHERLW